MLKVNSKDTRTKPTDVVAVYFGINQLDCENYYRATERQIEMKYK